jgi:hypothetical protein
VHGYPDRLASHPAHPAYLLPLPDNCAAARTPVSRQVQSRRPALETLCLPLCQLQQAPPWFSWFNLSIPFQGQKLDKIWTRSVWIKPHNNCSNPWESGIELCGVVPMSWTKLISSSQMQCAYKRRARSTTAKYFRRRIDLDFLFHHLPLQV